MKNLYKILRIVLGIGIFSLFSLAMWLLWEFWQQSQAIDPKTLESLLPSLNISALKKAADLLR